MFDEFYVKLKDIVNSAFNLGDHIPKPMIVRKVLISLPKRFHAKIIAIEESKDIDTIPLTMLIGNLQTYELDLVRIGKGVKSKNMALKMKNGDGDESSEDENSKFKSYITRKFQKFIKNVNVKASDKDHKLFEFLNLSLKIDSRENPKKLDKAATIWLVQSVMDVKGTDI